jgi:predicted nucleic acid-binding protein
VKVIPDSSFFICFINDLEGHMPFDERIRILAMITGYFSVILVPEVGGESPLQRLPQTIKEQFGKKNPAASYRVPDQSIELLRPLLGKGEHAVITCSFLHYRNGDHEFLFILDDGLARDLVGQILPVLTGNMKGTVGFLGDCACRKVLEKDEVIHLLTVLRKTKFRVDPSIITAVISGIKSRCP